MKNISILGSTGSIGQQTLSVIRDMPDKFTVVALSCGRRIDLLFQQILEFKPLLVSVETESDAQVLQSRLTGLGVTTEVFWGTEGNRLCACVPEANMVVAAMVGVKGLAPVVAAIDAGKDIALANKETLVAGGAIVLPKLAQAKVKLFPVDSEHSAIWQCLWGQPNGSLDGIYLTASGGPFRGYSQQQLETVTIKQALAHPTWSMGGKITIDSATMMNKGLEVIEASWLFSIPADQITVVVHPQSIIHSMIRMKDGSVLAQLGQPDMKLPIQVALCYPFRFDNQVNHFDPFAPGSADLHFEKCDTQVFQCLDLAYYAGRIGASLPAVMNSANEAAVEAFLAGKIAFTQIAQSVKSCMEAHEKEGLVQTFSVDDIYEMDQWSRSYVNSYLS